MATRVCILSVLFVAAVRGDTAVLSSPCGLAVTPAGELVVSCRGEKPALAVLSRTGEKLREVGPVSAPAGLAAGGQGDLLVADAGANKVLRFDARGKLLGMCEGLAAPSAVALGRDGAIAVADTGNNRIAVVTNDVARIAYAFDAVSLPDGTRSALKAPRGVAAAGERLAIADTGNGRVLLVAFPAREGETPAATVISGRDMEPKAVTFGKDERLYVIDRQQVRGYTREGKEFGTFKATAMRLWYTPEALAIDGDGSVLSVDASTRRVLVTSAELFDAEPRIDFDPRTPGAATVSWTTLAPRPTVLRYGLTEDCEKEVRDEKPVTAHAVTLENLAPAARYYFHATCPFDAIPAATPARADLALATQRRSYAFLADGNFCGEYPFATLPEAGKTEWTSLPVLVAVYRTVTYTPGADGARQPDRVLDDGDVAALRRELETYRLWAWRHSACALNLQYTFVEVTEPRNADQLGDITPVVLADLERGTAAQGKNLDQFWNVIVVGVHGWYANYLAGTVAGSTHELGACYTGFGHGGGAGWWWFPVHEHGHLLHSMIMCSSAGYFAFPDAPWTLPGKFGEDFSFMAYNYRQFPRRNWLLLKRSTICQSADADGDNVPDDDPRVPLDTRRFGWTPALGGTCLMRLMAGLRTPGFTGSTDTDYEGNVHALNPGELYWIDRKVPRATPHLDGTFRAAEWNELYSVPNLTTPKDARRVKAKLFAAWDEGHYYFAVRSDRRVNASLDLDGANDGWFHGRDNLRFSVRPQNEGATADGAIWDFLNDTLNVHDGQHWYREAYRPGDIAAAAGKDGEFWVLVCAVPARPAIGIAPALGARFALRVTLSADPPDPIPGVGFFDGEDFVYDLECTATLPLLMRAAEDTPAKTSAPRLLVIAPTAFHAALKDFVAHKQTLLPAELRSLEDILARPDGVDAPEKLKRFLYEEWRRQPLGYALLVGDADTLPVRYMVLDRITPAAFDYSFYPSDLYYADLANGAGAFDDWNASKEDFHATYFGEVRGEKNKKEPINFDGIHYLPEIAVGRWPVNTAEQAARVVAKTIGYEQRVLAGTSPNLRNAAFFAVGGWVDSRGLLDALAAKLAPAWHVEKRFYANRGQQAATPPPNHEQLRALMNGGLGLAVHTGHGQPDAWEQCFTLADLARIDNAACLPVVISAGCSTAYFATLPPYEPYVDVDGKEHAGSDHGEVFTAPPPPPAPYQRGRYNTTGLGEQLLTRGPNGAVAYIGCNTGSQPCGLTLVEGFVTALAAADAPRLGDVWRRAIAHYFVKERLATLVPDAGWYPPSIFFQGMKFMVFGDPSLRLPGR